MHRRLIVNADDYGLSDGVNHGIIRCHDEGILTSASLMVRHTAAKEASSCARERTALSVGLHLDFGEWDFRDGKWTAVYEVVSCQDRRAVEMEIQRQLDTFCQLMGQFPTHLDSHQHVHMAEPVRSAMVEAAVRLNVPLRNVTPNPRFCGDFYGQSGKGEPHPEWIRVEALVDLLQRLPSGATELGCHPGCDLSLASRYCTERAVEVATLCDPVINAAVRELQIELCSFSNFRENCR